MSLIFAPPPRLYHGKAADEFLCAIKNEQNLLSLLYRELVGSMGSDVGLLICKYVANYNLNNVVHPRQEPSPTLPRPQDLP